MNGKVMSENSKFTKVQDHSTANTTAVNSTGVDMAGYEGVIFITSFGTAAANNTVNLAQGDSLGGSYDDLEGTEVASGTAADVWIDVFRPLDRFVRMEATRGTSSTLESVWAIRYGPLKAPPDNTIDATITGETHISPAEGTK